MHLLVHIPNFLLHHVICTLLVFEHHLHEVEFALHETSSAQCAINILDIKGASFSAFLLDSLQSSLQVHKLAGKVGICCAILSRECVLAGQGAGALSSHIDHTRGQSCLVNPLTQLLVENSTLLINLDDWSALIVVDHSS